MHMKVVGLLRLPLERSHLRTIVRIRKKGGGGVRKKLKQFFALSESAGRVAAEDS